MIGASPCSFWAGHIVACMRESPSFKVVTWDILGPMIPVQRLSPNVLLF